MRHNDEMRFEKVNMRFEKNHEFVGKYNFLSLKKNKWKWSRWCKIALTTTMLKSSLCDYCDAYILVKGTTSVTNTAAAYPHGTN